MDGGLLSGDSLSEDEDLLKEKGKEFITSSPLPYTELFNKHFPYYLSIGMSEEQYWDKDCLLVKFYREAEELRNEKLNQQTWLQGMYFYDAIARVSPILRSHAKRGTKAQPYVEQPYPISKKTIKETELKKEKINAQKGLCYMEAYMVKNNRRFEERE